MIDVREEVNEYVDELLEQAQEFLNEIEEKKIEIKRQIAKSKVIIAIAKHQGMPWEEEEEKMKHNEKVYNDFCQANAEKVNRQMEFIGFIKSLKE